MDSKQRIVEGFAATFQRVDQRFAIYMRVIIYECVGLNPIIFEYLSAIAAFVLSELQETRK